MMSSTIQQIATLLAIALVVMGIQFTMRYLRSRRLRRWLDRGMDAYKAQRFEEALHAFKKCVNAAPEWLYVRTLMCICLAKTHQLEAALKEIKFVEALQPKQAETWTLISLFHALCQPNDHDALYKALEHLVSLDADAAATLIQQAPFAAVRTAPGFQNLRQRIAVEAQEPR